MSVVAIKIECQCGQHYSFDVEPVGGQMPTSIACPACGADGTGTANELISRSVAEPRSLVSMPRSIKTAARPASGVQGRRTPSPRVPVGGDAARDLIEAKLDIKRATSAALIVAGLDLLLAILSLCGIRILGADLWILVDVIIVAGLAYGIHRFSRTCAVLMSIYYLALCVLLLRKTGIASIVFRAVFLYYFARGAQAMFTYHKLGKRIQ
jgi:uncharacterized membrane protein YjgN (DUF898 family)